MIGRPAISLADVLRVTAVLRADGATADAIAGLLDVGLPGATASPPPAGATPSPAGDGPGIEAPEPAADRPATEPAQVAVPSADRAAGPPAARPPEPGRAPGPEPAPADSGRYVIPVPDFALLAPPLSIVERVTDREPPPVVTGDWADFALVEMPSAADEPPSRPEPLFPAGRSRAVLTTLLSVADAVGDLDVEAMVADVASGGLVTERRRRRLTIRNGVQVLIDTGAGMMPYALDAAMLEEEVERLAGDDASVLRFVGCPTGPAGAGAAYQPWPRYRPPDVPTRIVVVSDLGLGVGDFGTVPASADDWLRFARLMERARCPLTVLTPYPAERLPPILRAALRTVRWDERTSIGAVSRLAPRW